MGLLKTFFEWKSLSGKLPFHLFKNYPDIDLGNTFGADYFGEENFERLKSIKTQYDPDNIFRNGQSIPSK